MLHRDALEYDVRAVFPQMPAKLLGNLPYYVTSPILFQYGDDPSPFSRMVLTIQREFAERLAAVPAHKGLRRTHADRAAALAGEVPAHHPGLGLPAAAEGGIGGHPASRRARPARCADCDGRRFAKLVKMGFSQRRKQLGKLLAEAVPDWPEAARELGVRASRRGRKN